MKVVLGFALAVSFAAIIAAVRFSVAADAAALASSSPTNTPVVQSTAPPKVLGHQIVSAFCTTFVARFNDAATTLHVDDQLLDDATAAETDYENDFSRLDGALRSWDHRLALIAALGRIMRTIPQTQAAVSDLRAQAAATSDAERRTALIEGASQLQTSMDHQRIVARELNDAVDAMLDLHTAEDTVGSRVSGLSDTRKIFNAGAGDAPVPHPGDTLPQARAHGAYYASAVESILHMPRDRSLTAEAESNATAAVAGIMRSCEQDTAPAATPSPSPKR
jgi:hypothetical protein